MENKAAEGIVKKKTYQTANGVVMVMCVTYSLPLLHPHVQGVTHSQTEEKRVSL